MDLKFEAHSRTLMTRKDEQFKTSESSVAPKDLRQNLPKRGYWYYTTVYNCPLCGHETLYKERQYTPKPADWQERIEFIPEAYHCGY